MLLKVNAKVDELSKEMYFAAGVVEHEFARSDHQAVITSGNDSTHMEGSKHYSNNALDFRLRNIPPVTRAVLVSRIRAVLNPLGFDILHESIYTENEHIHIEWDPKGTESIFNKEK